MDRISPIPNLCFFRSLDTSTAYCRRSSYNLNSGQTLDEGTGQKAMCSGKNWNESYNDYLDNGILIERT